MTTKTLRKPELIAIDMPATRHEEDAEPTGMETIVALPNGDGTYGPVRRYHALRSRSGNNGGAR